MYHLKKELSDTLLNARLEKIFFDGKSFYFQLYRQKERNYLKFNLTGGKSSCYITETVNTLNIDHPLLLTLRKHLTSSILIDIKQLSTDRVYEFHFKEFNIVTGVNIKILIFEATGRHNNLYLVDEDMEIIDCYRKIFSDTNRTLIPKATFKHMESNKISLENYKYNDNANELINKYDGISKNLALYLVQNPLVKPLSLKVIPSLYYNKIAYFYPILEQDYQTFNTISEAFDHKIVKVQSIKDKYFNFLNQQLKKVDKKKKVFEVQKLKAEKNLNYRHDADSIYASGLDLSLKIDTLNDISLDPLLTLNENAQRLYKLYHKAKRTLEYVKELSSNTESDYEMIISLINELELTNDNEVEQLLPLINELGYSRQKRREYKERRNKKQNKHRKQINITKFEYLDSIIYVGRNHVQNEYLINEIASRNDYWFHVKGAAGSHVILKTNNLTEELIRVTSMLAAYFSSQKLSSSIPVDYTLVKYLKKIPKLPSYKLNYSNEKTKYIDIDDNLIKSLEIGR